MGLIHLFGYTHQGSLFYPSAQVRSWLCSPRASAELPAYPSSAPQQPKGAWAGKQLCTAQGAAHSTPESVPSGLRMACVASIFGFLELCSQSTLKHSQQKQKEGKESKESALLTANSTTPLLQLWDKNPSAWEVWTIHSVSRSGLTEPFFWRKLLNPHSKHRACHCNHFLMSFVAS